jgi:hypothetical protein
MSDTPTKLLDPHAAFEWLEHTIRNSTRFSPVLFIATDRGFEIAVSVGLGVVQRYEGETALVAVGKAMQGMGAQHRNPLTPRQNREING